MCYFKTNSDTLHLTDLQTVAIRRPSQYVLLPPSWHQVKHTGTRIHIHTHAHTHAHTHRASLLYGELIFYNVNNCFSLEHLYI